MLMWCLAELTYMGIMAVPTQVPTLAHFTVVEYDLHYEYSFEATGCVGKGRTNM